MFKSFVKYGLVTIINYFVLFFGTFFLVEKFDFPPNIVYFIVITFLYFITFVLYTKYVFVTKLSKKIFLKFIIALFSFWLLNNIFYFIMLNIFFVQYLLALSVNIVFWGGVRFFVYKNFVFRNERE